MDDRLERHLLRASPDALWFIGLDGSTLYANERLEALIGRTTEELVALGPASALVVSRPEDLAAHEEHLEEMRAHHPGRQNDEVIAVRPDGSQVWLMAGWAPVHDDDGSLLGYLHRLVEYTERRALLDRLSDRETELETAQEISERAAEDANQARQRLKLFSAIADAANRSDRLDVALGRAWAALQSVEGWRSLGVWGRSDLSCPPELLSDLSPPEWPAGPPEVVAEVPSWTTGEVTLAACSRTGHTAVWLPVRLAGTTIRLIHLEGDVDQVDDAVLQLLDQVGATLSRVAEREQAAVELAAARDAAMAASAHKSAFLATMSHEIRTPMNGVIGLNELLLRTELDAHQRHLAEGLRGAGLTLLTLINDILDLSKIESGTVELERVPFEVAQLLDQTGVVIAPQAQEKQLELVLGCDPAVPRTLVGDRVRLGQVLTNLASNAVKFTERGEVVVDLTLDRGPRSGSEPGTVLLRGEVRDTGIGIGEDPSGLFDAFTQADHSTTRSHGGTGLGLAISRRLVQDMGGSIGADERAGGGSTFWFVVPLGVVPPGSEAPALPGLPPRRVLVVDDNPSAAAVLDRQLRAWGLDVDRAHSAPDAMGVLLAAAGTEAAHDLVLVDLHMPGADGLALARSVAAHHGLGDLALLLLSDDPSTRLEDVTVLGFAGTVDKPVRTADLHRAVRHALATPGSTPPAPAPERAPEDDVLALHVLVVEDNPINQLVAQGLLERLGCTSAVAANGEEAVTALEPGHGFDLVLMDCRMPRMDGYQATRLIRAREDGGERVPIVAMTASALEGERDRCLAAGMDDFLSKPVDTASLARVVGRYAAAAQAAPAAPAAEAAPASTTYDLGPVLDPARVEMLEELVRDGITFFDRTRASFLARIDDTVGAIRAAHDRGDLAEVGAVAHQLRGSALNLGLTRVGAAAGRVEEAAGSGDTTALATAFDDLAAHVVEGVHALVEVRAGEPAP